MRKKVFIIGAGLAGSEAALQLCKHGYDVYLYDQKGAAEFPLYQLDTFAELVCNNALSPNNQTTPLGRLFHELKAVNSELVSIALKHRVADNNFIAVDKEGFSSAITSVISEQKNIQVFRKKIRSLPKERPLIIATGPLTDEYCSKEISALFGCKQYHFSDASSPVIDISTINLSHPAVKRISPDLYAVILDSEQFNQFRMNLVKASVYTEKIADDLYDLAFEKCKSIEALAKQSDDELRQTRFNHPYINDKNPVLLLRRENALTKGFIMTGCTTTLRHKEQDRIFSCLPGFKSFKMIKYGRMHRNTFFDSPSILNCFYEKDNIYLIGQLSGIDGYLPSISSGFVSAYRIIKGSSAEPFPGNSMIGALANYISNNNVVRFEPMCASYALLSNNKSLCSLTDLKKNFCL